MNGTDKVTCKEVVASRLKSCFNCFKTKPQIPFLGEASSNKRESFGSSVLSSDLKNQASFVFLPQKFCGNSAKEFLNFDGIANFLFG